MSLAVGDVVEGVVSNLTKFGAFVNLDSGLTRVKEVLLISIGKINRRKNSLWA